MEKDSPCKVNLLLNILGRRPDGFHELETVLHPVGFCDRLRFDRAAKGIELTCNDPRLPTDGQNLVFRAADAFLKSTRISSGVRIHLEKRIPMAAGLGGGSGNAATTLLGLNELFGQPLAPAQLQQLATGLGSDVPFFLQSRPALGTGRGEILEPLDPFPCFCGAAFLLIHPGFGISTPWAYQQLRRFPCALNGRPGRARELVNALQAGPLKAAASGFYNSLEAPAFEKHPILALYRDFLVEEGAAGALMSGSGSTVFGVCASVADADRLAENFRTRFGSAAWVRTVPAAPAPA
ncbi:MAG TPA: 4-(cytidine 5'-diphospho)-2-C-methyl-D-erythritol kinase [Verrucomicrobiota bacterium]|nr:4-(cytidine 5'-diphospho)-2-C-methyl-D-erythritol kinase [Verrucomicrobiota bacterium]